MDETASPEATDRRPRRLSLRPEWRDNRLSFVLSIRPSQNASKAMDITQSPLTQDTRPEVFEKKVVTLYRQLFASHDADDFDLDERFWQELFLLRPDIPQLRRILEGTDSDTLLHIEDQTRQLVLNSIDAVKAREDPSDDNALDTLSAFLAVVLAKKYTNPSSDIIEVLAGLDNVDTVFTSLVATLEQTIRDGRGTSTKQKAVRTAVAVVAGGYQTALISYFLHRDFFPALIKLVAQEDPLEASIPFLLIGLLADYDKFESASNSYRTRFGDFVNESSMARISECIGWTSTLLRDMYVALQDDTPATWSIGGTLAYVGLGAVTGSKPAVTLTEDEQKIGLSQLPGPQAAILLPLYDFILANKYYAQSLIAQAAPDKTHATPFAALLSFMSYLLQHAHRSVRTGWYAYLSSLILSILVSDPDTSKAVMTRTATVRLCQQRPPFLPVAKSERPYLAAIIDIAIDGVNHNLRKKLDATLYIQLLYILSRSLNRLTKSQTKLTYHWSELWRSLLSFIRFLAAYPEDIRSHYNAHSVAEGVVGVLSTALRHGETFVPNAKDYDDLVYKLVESGDALTQFRDTYGLQSDKDHSSGIDMLINVSKHYRSLIDEKHGSKVVHLSPREVSKVIKQGYETLNITETTAQAASEQLEAFREGDHKSSLKRMMRVVLADAQALLISEVPAGLI